MSDLPEIMAVLRRWEDAITGAEAALEALNAATGSNPEAPLPTAIYTLQGLADEWAAASIGTAVDWLEWYRLENDMGERGHEAGFASESSMRPIRTLDDFAKLLADDVARADAEAAHG